MSPSPGLARTQYPDIKASAAAVTRVSAVVTPSAERNKSPNVKGGRMVPLRTTKVSK